MNTRRTFIRRALAAAVTAVAALYVPGRPWELGVQEVSPQSVFPSNVTLELDFKRVSDGLEIVWK